MTLALAVIGTALGLLNTGVMLWQWNRSGPTVNVELLAGWQVSGNGIASFPASSFSENHAPSDAVQAVVVVQVTDSGRSAIDVREWWVNVGSAKLGMVARADPEAMKALVQLDPMALASNLDAYLLNEHNEPCPYRLNSHATKSWVMPMERIAEIVTATVGQAPALSASVALGDGRTKRSKEQVEPDAFHIQPGTEGADPHR